MRSLYCLIWGAARRYALSLARVHTHTRTHSAVILMDSPTEEWGEDRNMVFVQTIQ